MIKTIVEVENDEIVEVKTLWDEKEVNFLLSSNSGWLLFNAAIAHKDGAGFQAKPCWLLGRKK